MEVVKYKQIVKQKVKKKPVKMPVGAGGTFRLTKWDCETVPEVTDPQADPRCSEIVEWELGKDIKTIYKRT